MAQRRKNGTATIPVAAEVLEGRALLSSGAALAHQSVQHAAVHETPDAVQHPAVHLFISAQGSPIASGAAQSFSINLGNLTPGTKVKATVNVTTVDTLSINRKRSPVPRWARSSMSSRWEITRKSRWPLPGARSRVTLSTRARGRRVMTRWCPPGPSSQWSSIPRGVFSRGRRNTNSKDSRTHSTSSSRCSDGGPIFAGRMRVDPAGVAAVS